jgi:phage shock protein C
MAGIPELIIIFVVLILPILVVVLAVVFLRRGSDRERSVVAVPAPPSRDQRTAGLERLRLRYSEERLRILDMLESGKITPEDAGRLFDTLDRETSTMACPYCGGDVQIEALRCKHCKRDLVEGVDQPRRLLRSRNRMLAGVCGGLAEYTGLDPVLMRLLVALIVFLSGIVTGLIAYFVATLIIPSAE